MSGGDPETQRIGEVIGGKYRIVRFLAKGGMGVVYEAQHAIVHRRFALKFLRPDLAGRRDILTRFQREAEAAGALENENVAAAVDFGISDDGSPYIVMEYLVGESLASVLEREERLPVARATDLVAQACRGVAAAHAAGIVHRDLKPHNLFVCRRDDGTDLLKVLDFGVAKLQAIDEASATTRTGTMLGTAAYMSPEQARGDKAVDSRADVYGLGAILYELLSGKKPHPGDSQNAILHHIATQPAVPLKTVEPDLPAELVVLVSQALASDPNQRPPSTEVLCRTLAPFAHREVWPIMREASGPTSPVDSALDGLNSTVIARAAGPQVPPGTPSVARSSTEDDRWAPSTIIHPRAPTRTPVPGPARASSRTRATLGAVVLVASVACIGLAVRHWVTAPRTGLAGQSVHHVPVLTADTRFLSSEPQPGAVQHIETLVKANAPREATLLNAMVATPVGIWLMGGTPQQVQVEVGDAVTRGGRQGRVPILVAYNLPFRDCTGYGLGGAADTAAYEAWIDGLASGIRNERAVVILEPNSLGLIPYGAGLDGTKDKCRPTRAETDGKRAASPGATPDERYAQLAYAIDSLAAKAPNAAVYIDGTHSSWLPVGDAAYRLERTGVDRAAGFFLNVGNYQPTARLIQYGTWIAKCIYHARASADGVASTRPYGECASPPPWTDINNDPVWSRVDAWYTAHVDQAPHPPAGPAALTHFVINTNRNGQGPLIAATFARPPYNQPPDVIEVLRDGGWCMPPNRGLGFRPTAKTGVALVDAYLWTEVPGISVASCDIAGGARAWDYTRYNPWKITGDAQNRFDPLWGRVLPPAGDWFPDEALQLVRNANPPLDGETTGNLARQSDSPAPPAESPPPNNSAPPNAPVVPSAATAVAVAPALDTLKPVPPRSAGRPVGHADKRGRPAGQVAFNPATHSPVSGSTAGPAAGPATASEPIHAIERPAAGPSFDSKNPYR